MYDWNDIEAEIEGYFKADIKLIEIMKAECKGYLSSVTLDKSSFKYYYRPYSL